MSVLRLIGRLCRAVTRAGVCVRRCGDAAGDAVVAPRVSFCRTRPMVLLTVSLTRLMGEAAALVDAFPTEFRDLVTLLFKAFLPDAARPSPPFARFPRGELFGAFLTLAGFAFFAIGLPF